MSELYELPDGWEWKTIEDLCEILDRLRKPISQRDRISGEFPYYGASGILDYIKDYIFDERLLLIGEDGAKWGSNENTSFIADGKYWVNNHAHIMRPNKDLVIDSLLVYYLNTTDLNEYITGATVKKLNQQKLKSIMIPTPPLSEQQRIVSKLDLLFEKIDKSIALHQKNMDEANAFMGSVLNDVFGELEEKYAKKQLGSVIKIIGGGTPSTKEREYWDNGTIKWATVGDMNVETIIDTELLITEKGLKESSSNIVPKDAIIIATRVGLGKVCYLDSDIAINQDLKGLLPLNDGLNIRFLYNYFCNIKDYIISNGTGATVKGVKLDFIKSIEIPLPSLNIQQKVVKYLDEISQKIEKIKQAQKTKMNSLKALKASILDQAFKGEL
jgi:type I restriction enzyme S subunit